MLSRFEYLVDDAVEPKEVGEVFVRQGRILELTIDGKLIRTTSEHPFYTKMSGWIPAGELNEGDLISTLEGDWLPIESLIDTGREETVYNFMAPEYHTYFVGDVDWPFAA